MTVSLTSLRTQLRRWTGSDRGWSLAAAFFGRIGGFFTSFLLARITGTAAVGDYSTVVSTSGSVVAPALTALSNSATLEGRAAGDTLPVVVLAHVVLGAALAAMGCAAFLAIASGSNVTSIGGLAMIAGLASVGSQMVTAALEGVLFGAGAFRAVALRRLTVAAVAIGSSVPVVFHLGLAGAFWILIATSCALPLFLTVFGLRGRGRARAGFNLAMRSGTRQLLHSVPSVGATVATSVATWLVAIYLTRRSHGADGVGVVAIGTQWLTLLVLAVTSWGGVTLRELSTAWHDGGDAFRAVIRAQIRKNLAVTLLGSTAVFAGAELIARVYHASGGDLAAVLRINAVTGLVMAASNIAERALYCSDRQRAWLGCTVLGACVTVGAAVVLVPSGIVYASVAALCGATVTCLASFVVLRWT